MEISPMDLEILRSVIDRDRISLRGINQNIGISARFLRSRIRILKSTGVLEDWTIHVNPRAFGMNRTIFLFIKTNPGEPTLLQQIENNYSQIQLDSLDGITGDYSLIGRLRLSTAWEDELRELDEIMEKARFPKYKIVEAIGTYKEEGFDPTDPKILLNKQKRARLEKVRSLLQYSELPPTISLIGRTLSISQSAATRLLRTWQETNVILTYSAKLGPKFPSQLYGAKFYLRIKARPGFRYHDLARSLIQEQEIFSLYRTGEEYALMAIVRTKTVRSFDIFLKRLYTEFEGVEDTHSVLVLEERRSLLRHFFT